MKISRCIPQLAAIVLMTGILVGLNTKTAIAEASLDAQNASFTSEYQWFKKGQPTPLSADQKWVTSAWRGERIQKQLLINGLSRRSGLQIQIIGLTNGIDKINSDQLSVYFPTYVKGDIEARDCDGYPDDRPHVELTDALFETPDFSQFRGSAAPVWLSIDVPKNISAGAYAGELSIASKGREIARLNLAIEVQEWTLPPSKDWDVYLNLWQFPTNVLDRYNDSHGQDPIEAWSEEHYALLEPTYRYLASLGQTSITTYIKEGALGAPTMVKWIAHDGGDRWTFDYSVFDAYVERLASWGISEQIDAFSPVGWNRNEIPFWDADSKEQKNFPFPIGSPEANAIWDLFLTDFERHLREKGWFEKTVLYMDEIPAEEMEKVIGLIRFNNPDWKIGLAYSHEQPPKVVGALYDVSGIFETEQWVETYQGQVASFYTSCTQMRPNVYVAANGNPADTTAMSWYALARGYHGYLRWAFDRWTAGDPLDLTDSLFTAGDGSFVYRGKSNDAAQLVRSVRSELLRDGLEDYEKVRIMSDRLAECSALSALNELRAVASSFTVSALKNGEAQNLVISAKSALAEIGRKYAPSTCNARH